MGKESKMKKQLYKPRVRQAVKKIIAMYESGSYDSNPKICPLCKIYPDECTGCPMAKIDFYGRIEEGCNEFLSYQIAHNEDVRKRKGIKRKDRYKMRIAFHKNLLLKIKNAEESDFNPDTWEPWEWDYETE